MRLADAALCSRLLPVHSGKNPDAICDKLHEDNIFAVPLAAGVRIAVCAVPLKKIAGMAAKVQAAMQAVEK